MKDKTRDNKNKPNKSEIEAAIAKHVDDRRDGTVTETIHVEVTVSHVLTPRQLSDAVNDNALSPLEALKATASRSRRKK